MAYTYLTGYNGTVRTLASLLSWSHWVNLDPEMQRRVLALLNASIAAGRPLGIGEIFRSYEAQKYAFLSRHQEVPSGGCHGWNGKRYQLRKGYAEAAPPGSSYHEATTPDGKALAIDFTGNLSFLKENADRYGLIEFSNVNGEPWHGQTDDDEIPQPRRYYNAATMHPLRKMDLPDVPTIPPTPPTTKVYAPKPTIEMGGANVIVEVRALQLLCNFWGWRDALGRTVIVDGDYGAKSAQAVMAMQRALKLTVDGIYGPATASALQKFLDAMAAYHDAPPPSTPPPFEPQNCKFGLWPVNTAKPYVTIGSFGDVVLYAQSVLKCKANKTSIVLDGKYGPQTAGYIKDVQNLFSLPAHGNIDAPTWNALDYLAKAT